MTMRSLLTGTSALTVLFFLGSARADAAPPAAAPATGEAGGDAPALAGPAAQPAPTADQPAAATSNESSSGDVRSAKNMVYAEGLGPGLFYSINYERNIVDDLSARIGFGYVSLSASASGGGQTASASASYLTVPVTVSYLGIGSKKHIFELGGGATIAHVGAGASTLVDSASASATVVIPTLLAGYRIQPPDGGFFFKIGASPMIVQGTLVPWGYLALGGVF
ncbi:MAG TPA: hypothetical protein VHE30_23670 [Polyangiaceae bacterium]|nr:hypothetical protein [Polyangiaceae bacterium]